MKKSKPKMSKITADFVIDEYLKTKKLKGIKKKTAIARVKFLSQNLNKFLSKETQNSL